MRDKLVLFRYNLDNSSRRGFTIIELLVVIVVIGILAAITITSYSGIQQKATIASLQSDLNNAAKQLKLNQITDGTYPVSLSAANGGKGIPSSPGTTYQYATDNSTNPPSFCITATKGTTTYKLTNDSPPVAGDCLDYGLVLQLDAGNLNSYPGSGNLWNDLSGMGNNGTMMNGANFVSSNGGSISFDGVDDYIESSNNIEWPGALSVASWHKRASKDTVNADGIVGNWYWTSSTLTRRGWILRYYINTDNLAFIIELTDSTSVQEVQASYTITSVGNWYYVVGVFNPLDLTVKIYVNGVLRNTTSASVGYNQIAFDSINPMRVGYSSVNGGYFPGLISDSRIYNRVLSAAEIQKNYDNLRNRYGL